MNKQIRRFCELVVIIASSVMITGCAGVQIARSNPDIDDQYEGKFGYVMGSIGAHPFDFDLKFFFTRDLVSPQPLFAAHRMGDVHFEKICTQNGRKSRTFARAFLVKVPVGEYFFSSYQIRVASGVLHSKGRLNRQPFSSKFTVNEGAITYVGRFTGVLIYKEGAISERPENIEQLYVSVADKFDDDFEMVKHLSDTEYYHMNLPFPESAPISTQIVSPLLSNFIRVKDIDEEISSGDCETKKYHKVKK